MQGQAESEVERLYAELAELERREQKRAAAAGKPLPLWRPPGEHIASLGGSSVASSVRRMSMLFFFVDRKPKMLTQFLLTICVLHVKRG